MIFTARSYQIGEMFIAYEESKTLYKRERHRLRRWCVREKVTFSQAQTQSPDRFKRFSEAARKLNFHLYRLLELMHPQSKHYARAEWRDRLLKGRLKVEKESKTPVQAEPEPTIGTQIKSELASCETRSLFHALQDYALRVTGERDALQARLSSLELRLLSTEGRVRSERDEKMRLTDQLIRDRARSLRPPRLKQVSLPPQDVWPAKAKTLTKSKVSYTSLDSQVMNHFQLKEPIAVLPRRPRRLHTESFYMEVAPNAGPGFKPPPVVPQSVLPFKMVIHDILDIIRNSGVYGSELLAAGIIGPIFKHSLALQEYQSRLGLSPEILFEITDL